MTETAVGTAKMSLTLDTSDYTVALERAKQQQAGLGQVAQQEAAKMTAAQRRVITSLENQANKVGLTREQWLQYKVITQTTGEVQTALLARIKANTAAVEQQGAALQKTGTQFNKYGLSVKQEAAALRQVPAQLTDIFVSLQGGQNPLTVLLQQGGQLKDVFGGVTPAVRALGNALVGLINPYTILAAVLGTIAAAYLSAEGRANAFNRALILTGNQSGLTSDKLSDMALSLDELSGVTARQAATALTEVVASGRIAAEQFELVTTAAVLMEDATGKAISETVAEYADLARDPVSAILKLNEAEHFLTASVYERIRALQDAGDIEGAAALATETRAAMQIERAQAVVESLGLVSGAWHSIKEGAGEAWDGAVNYFDTVDREAKETIGLLGRLRESWFGGSGAGRAFSVAAALNPPPSPSASPSADPVINTAAQRQLDALISGNRTREERQELEEQQIVNLYRQLGISKEDQRVQDALARSRQQYKDSLPKGNGESEARAFANATAAANIQAIKNQEDVTRAEIANTSKVLQAEYGARIVTASEYYAKQRELTASDFAAQEQSLVQQIEFLRSREVAGKDSVNVLRQITELEAKLAKVRADGATQLVILGIQESDVAAKRKLAMDSYQESLDSANAAAKQSADASLARILLGEREAAQQERLAAITADYAEKQRQLAREYAETGDAELYQQKSNALRQFMEEQVRIVQDGYDRMREAESDWLNGFRGGVAQWVEGASNVAQQANAITQRSLDGATEMLTNFALTGKLTWRSLLADIGEQIVRFMMKQAVLQFIKMFASYWTGGIDAEMGMTDLGSTGGPTYAALGGVFPGAKGLSNFSGTVVNRPTPFYFAKGAGVMGEAGMEGIFPLQRGADGKLGVKAMGGVSSPVYITTNVTVNKDGSTNSSTMTAGEQASMYKDLGNAISTGAQREIARAMMPGGVLWKAGVQ
jgi:lambda family phage tail tape measure protein